MKKIFILAFGLVSLVSNAQKTIVEENFENDNVPLGYNFSPKSNKLVIQKGKHVGASTNRSIKSLIQYDNLSDKKILLDNAEVMNPQFSDYGNFFSVMDFAAMKWTNKIKFFLNDKQSNFVEYDKASKYFLTNEKLFTLIDKKGDAPKKLDEENVDLQIFDAFTNKESNLKITLPNVIRLSSENLLKQVVGPRSVMSKKFGLGYTIQTEENNTFSIVSKSISNDFKSMSLFRTFYDLTGKNFKDIEYKISLDNNNFLIYNNCGYEMAQGAIFDFANDLSVNNFKVDNKTGDIYIYGLFASKVKDVKDCIKNSPKGYYVFKFDINGKFIWSSFNNVNNKNFNSDQYLSYLTSDLKICNNKLLFISGPKMSNKEFFVFTQIDNSTGKELNSNYIEYKEDKVYTMMTGTRDFILSFFTTKDLKNKIFDDYGLVLYNINSKIKSYVDSINSKNKIYFHTQISDLGIWLIESDNETYYKVTYFNHE